MVIIITKDSVIKEKSIGKISHEKVCQEIIDSLPIESINLSKINGDFGNIIPSMYGFIFIRISIVLTSPTIIYYPTTCNEFQIEALEEFNNIVKAFNRSKKERYNIELEYNGQSEDRKNNIDDLLEEITVKKMHK